MAVSYKHPRGTRASLDTLASASGLIIGQIYLITDEKRLAVATSTGSFTTLAKEVETEGWTVTETVTGSATITLPESDLDGSDVLVFVNGLK